MGSSGVSSPEIISWMKEDDLDEWGGKENILSHGCISAQGTKALLWKQSKFRAHTGVVQNIDSLSEEAQVI